MANPRVDYCFSDSGPKLDAPPSGRIMVHLVINVENWQFDSPMPRAIITPPHGKETVPDVPNFSWADYGMRAGLPRIIKAISERGLSASTSLNAGVIDAYPQAAEEILKAGWEFIGHGMHQRSLNHSQQDSESELIEACLSKLKTFTGKKVRGWLSPGLRETFDTPDILKSLGVEYVCDWVIDDVPRYMKTQFGPLLSVPYNLEINDSIIFAIEKHQSEEMYHRLARTLRLFERECLQFPRILAVGLHPHLIGVPHRLESFERMLDLLISSPHVNFMTGSEICDWYTSQIPSPV